MIKGKSKSILSSISILVGISSIFCSNAFGHAGHDHSHWISSTIHGLTVVSIITVMVIGLSLLLGKSIFMLAQRKNTSNREARGKTK